MTINLIKSLINTNFLTLWSHSSVFVIMSKGKSSKINVKDYLESDQVDLSLQSFTPASLPVKDIAAIKKGKKLDLSKNQIVSLPVSKSSKWIFASLNPQTVWVNNFVGFGIFALKKIRLNFEKKLLNQYYAALYPCLTI